MNTIQEIEGVSKSKEYVTAITFFLFFSRFEYALKRNGYFLKSKNENEISANWSGYAQKRKMPDCKEAISFLEKSPPKKQISTEGEKMSWADDNFSGSCDLDRLLVLVRRIRNNLFHGGKFPEGPEPDTSRDAALIQAGLTILQACLDSDTKLKSAFLEGLK